MHRIVIAVALAAVSLLPAGARAHGVVGCGGSAPLTTWCSSGWHVYDDEHDEQVVYGHAPFTGYLVSTLEHVDGSLGRACEFAAGVARNCVTWGADDLALGTPLYHTCSAYLIGQAAVGAGEFTCLVR